MAEERRDPIKFEEKVPVDVVLKYDTPKEGKSKETGDPWWMYATTSGDVFFPTKRLNGMIVSGGAKKGSALRIVKMGEKGPWRVWVSVKNDGNYVEARDDEGADEFAPGAPGKAPAEPKGPPAGSSAPNPASTARSQQPADQGQRTSTATDTSNRWNSEWRKPSSYDASSANWVTLRAIAARIHAYRVTKALFEATSDDLFNDREAVTSLVMSFERSPWVPAPPLVEEAKAVYRAAYGQTQQPKAQAPQAPPQAPAGEQWGEEEDQDLPF